VVSLLAMLVTVLVGVLIVFTLARILPGVVARPLVRLMLSRKHRNTIPQVRPCSVHAQTASYSPTHSPTPTPAASMPSIDRKYWPQDMGHMLHPWTFKLAHRGDPTPSPTRLAHVLAQLQATPKQAPIWRHATKSLMQKMMQRGAASTSTTRQVPAVQVSPACIPDPRQSSLFQILHLLLPGEGG
jgi:hypothetical protein